MNLNIYSAIDWISGIGLILIFFTISLRGEKLLSVKFFSLMTFFTGIWSFLIAASIIVINKNYSLLLAINNHYLGILISTFFLLFSLTYPNKKIGVKIFIIFLIINLTFIYLLYFTDLIILKMIKLPGIKYHVWQYGKFWIIFDCYFIFSWLYGISKLIKTISTTSGEIFRKNLREITITISIGIIFSTTTTIILPQLGIYEWYWLGPLSGLFLITIFTYLITARGLFNVKLIVAQTTIVILCFSVLIKIFINSKEGVIIDGLFLLLIVSLGTLTLRSIRGEVQHREYIQYLANRISGMNKNLSKKIIEQTAEIKKSYDTEKRVRRDLEKLNETKNKFIMIAQHNLRTPITGILHITKNLTSEKYEFLTSETYSAITKIQNYTDHLNQISNDFLNIATLKIGSSILEITRVSLKKTLEAVIEELNFDIEEMNLIIKLPQNNLQWPLIYIDDCKLYEVIFIIIENAIKYNVRNGKIIVTKSTKNSYFFLKIESTGVGMTSDEIYNVFKHSFYRGEEAKIKHPNGMGIGLSLSRSIVQAHHGELYINSEGKNRGVEVIIQLPLNFYDHFPSIQ